MASVDQGFHQTQGLTRHTQKVSHIAQEEAWAG